MRRPLCVLGSADSTKSDCSNSRLAWSRDFDGPKSEEAKSRAMCIADTFARRIGLLTDPAALARILYDYDKMMNVRGRPPRET